MRNGPQGHADGGITMRIDDHPLDIHLIPKHRNTNLGGGKILNASGKG